MDPPLRENYQAFEIHSNEGGYSRSANLTWEAKGKALDQNRSPCQDDQIDNSAIK